MKSRYTLPAAVTLVGVLSIISVIVNLERKQTEAQLQQAQPLLVNSTQQIQQGQYNKARISLEQALEIVPNHAITHNNLGFTCQQVKDFACAETHFLKAIELNPRNWQFHKNLASLYDIQQRYSEAEAKYQEALNLAPQNSQPAIIADFTRLLNRTGKHAQALEQAQLTLAQTQEIEIRAALLNNIAWAYWKTRDNEKAEESLRESIKIQSTVDNLCLLSQIQHGSQSGQSDRLKQCQEKVQTTLAQNPNLFEFKPEIKEWSQADRT